MLTPEDIGLKSSDEHIITLKSLFINNKIITKGEFGNRFAPINFLNYVKLKAEVEQNCKNDKGIPIKIVEQETLPYITSTLTDLFQVNQKGSKRFRNILTPNVKTRINFPIEQWKVTLNTNRVCESEVQMGYQSMQTKEFSRQLLDFKARILLRKTQFPNQINKWSPDVSPYCKFCMDKGDHQTADLKHTLFECPNRLTIIEYIRENLTKQAEVGPVNILFCTNRCIYQTHETGALRKVMLKPHDKCAVFNKAPKQRGTALDFIWTNYMKIIMETLYKNQTPAPKMVLDEIKTEIKAQIKAKPRCPVSQYLEIILKNANTPNPQ